VGTGLQYVAGLPVSLLPPQTSQYDALRFPVCPGTTVLYELVSRRRPFEADNIVSLAMLVRVCSHPNNNRQEESTVVPCVCTPQITNAEPRQLPASVNPVFRRLILWMLKRNPRDRPGVSELLADPDVAA
jgi:serine/threonine protein kinase